MSIRKPREGLLAPTFSKEVSPIKGSPHQHTSYVNGNKLAVLGGGQNSKAVLDTDIWNKLNLRWKNNQSAFSGFTSSACKVKVTTDSYLLIGGVLNEGDKGESTVLRINLTEEIVEEMPPIERARSHQSCELLEDSEVVLISGGTERRPNITSENFLLPDELYTISTGISVPSATSLNRYQHRLIRLKETIYAFGGFNSEGIPMTLVEKFNKTTTSWEDDDDHLLSNHTGEVAVTAFPLESIDCNEGCTCGVSRSNPAVRILNGKEAEVTPTFFDEVDIFPFATK